MPDKPFFSIIIPTYNHAHLISRCLDSIVSQTYTNWEAIVVNNFSQDNTIEIVEGYNDPRIRLINNANNGIIAVSRNKGISQACGEWICFLDSDDWWTPNKLEVCIPYLNEFDFLYHDMYIYRERKKIGSRLILRGRAINQDYPIPDMFMNGNPIINSSVVLRKNVAECVGSISEWPELIAVEDMDYWLRIMSQNKRHRYISKSLGYYFKGSNISASLNQIDRFNNIYKKYENNLSSKDRLRVEAHINYDTARIYHINGKLSNAKKYYLRTIHDKYNLCRSVIGYALACLKKKY